jgi:membrane protein required for colicin V production
VSFLDLVLIAIVGGSIVSGFLAGFARAGVGFLAAVTGVLFGFWFYGMPAAWVHKYVHSLAASNLLAFFLIFFAFIFAGALLGMLLAKFFRWTGLTWLDRLMGAMFGLIRGALIVVAFVAVLMAFVAKPMPNWMVNSKSLPYAIDASHALSQAAPAGIKNAFRDSMLEIRQAWVEQLQKARKELEPGRRPENENEKKSNEAARKGKA